MLTTTCRFVLIRFGVWLAGGYAHVFILHSVARPPSDCLRRRTHRRHSTNRSAVVRQQFAARATTAATSSATLAATSTCRRRGVRTGTNRQDLSARPSAVTAAGECRPSSCYSSQSPSRGLRRRMSPRRYRGSPSPCRETGSLPPMARCPDASCSTAWKRCIRRHTLRDVVRRTASSAHRT